MSNKLCGQVWDLALPRSERDVLMAMADHADDDGGRCYPSIDHLAWKTDYSSRQVQRAIAGLKAKGIVEVQANSEGGRGRLPEYRLYLGRADRKRSWESVKGDIPRTPSIYEPVLNPKTEPLREKTRTRPAPKPAPMRRSTAATPSSVTLDPADELQAAVLDACGLDAHLARSKVLEQVIDVAARLKARKFTAAQIRKAAEAWPECFPGRDVEGIEPPHPQQLAEWAGRRRAAEAMRKAGSGKGARPAVTGPGRRSAAAPHGLVPHIEY